MPNKRTSTFLGAALMYGLLSAAVALVGRAEDNFGPVMNGPIDLSKQKTLYVVGYAHLDTQWRWTYVDSIRDYLPNTLHHNFELFEKFPNYVFNFSGARRYQMMKEYYPDDYVTLKKYVAAGRWFPCGSSVDEEDSNVPCTESLIRHVLYGNEYFRREFGKASEEFMLPDCFGFQAGLPSVLAHAGVRGFSTQKLTWGSANGIPFKVGVWDGPDGQGIIAALDPGAYVGKVTEDLSQDSGWLARIENTGKVSGAFVDYHYFGTGDRGGAPDQASVRWVERSIAGHGPIHVVEGPADRMFKEITAEQRAHLPHYSGDLLLTKHSAGSVTSQAYMKRCNRKNELLADAAERASVAAAWLGGAPYPTRTLYDAWILLLGSQMHDMLPGTSVPKAYEYCWNDELLAANQFAAVERDGVATVISAMDTQAQGVPLVVYNPLATEREDAVEATVTFPGAAPEAVEVYDGRGQAVPAQILGRNGNTAKILFLAQAPSVGFTTYDVRAAGAPNQNAPLRISDTALENANFRVTLNEAGDVASIFDKRASREVLSAPAQLSFQHENPAEYPAWNMDWEDRKMPPRAFVRGPAQVRIVESGPVRVALEVERFAQGSRFTQQIRLAAGAAGDRVEFATRIDWQTRESSLKAAFPLSVGNPLATYDAQCGTVERGNNEPKKYEVPQHQWFDLTAADSTYGVAVLNDCKFGSDKPDDHTVRLTLLYSPGTRAGFRDEATQDFGRHEMLYALAPHAGDWRSSGTPWQAARLNQPLRAFQVAAHGGSLGRSFSLLKVSAGNVAATAIKKAENSDEIVVRLRELDGHAAQNVQITAAGSIASAREVNGQEQTIGPATLRDGTLVTDMPAYRLRAFALTLAKPATALAAARSQSVDLPYDLDAISTRANRADGAFDAEGRTYPAEQLPGELVADGITFKLGPTMDGAKNALICRGQSINLPAGDFDHVYLLAAAIDGDRAGTFTLGNQAAQRTVQDWGGYIGQWDNRQWDQPGPDGLTEPVGLAPGFVKTAAVAWFSSHRHHPKNGNEIYQYCYLYKYGLALPAGATALTLPNDPNIRIFAVSVARNPHDSASPAGPLSDTLEDRSGDTGPAIEPAAGTFHDSIFVTLGHPLYWSHGATVRYTTDGTTPTSTSPEYAAPFSLAASATVKAGLVGSNGKVEGVSTAAFTIEDTTPPTLKSVAAIGLQPALRLTFSEPVEKTSAESIAHYRLEPAADIASATLADDGQSVTLALAGKSPLAAGTQLHVSGVKDRSPAANEIKPVALPVDVLAPVYSLDAMACSGTGKDVAVPNLPVKGGDSWTINFMVNPQKQLDNHTVLAGFGQCADDLEGGGRLLCKFANGIHFWAKHRDVETHEPLDVGRWQMLTATYDGHVLRLYKDGRPIGDRAIDLADDQPTVHLAPVDPWDKQRTFHGEIRNFTIWPAALAPDTLKALWSSEKP